MELTESVLDETRRKIELFESSLPTDLDAMQVSPVSKLPYKALLYRENLIWRMTELGRGALESFETNRVVCGIVLTRAALETTAAMCYLCAKVESVVESGTIGDVDDYLMRLTMGTATAPAADSTADNMGLPRPIRIGNFIGQMGKDIDGVSHHYGVLSEYSHPNWAGTALYSKHNFERRSTAFGQNIRGGSTMQIGVNSLSASLLMFESKYNRVGDFMPAFVAVCEAN